MNAKLSQKLKKYVKFLIECPYMITDNVIHEANFENYELSISEKLYISYLAISFKMQTQLVFLTMSVLSKWFIKNIILNFLLIMNQTISL